MAKKPSKKQLAWRKKFAAMARKRSKDKKKKRKAKINGTTSLKIPTYRKNKTVNIKRGQSGKFTVGSINGLQNVILKKLEYDYGDLRIKLLKASTKSEKNKIKKEISSVIKRRNKVLKMKPD